jgi:hypothetical protein
MIEEMIITELRDKLIQAQHMLSDVYQYACENGIEFVERNMSCADGCIGESLDWLSKE